MFCVTSGGLYCSLYVDQACSYTFTFSLWIFIQYKGGPSLGGFGKRESTTVALCLSRALSVRLSVCLDGWMDVCMDSEVSTIGRKYNLIALVQRLPRRWRRSVQYSLG